MKIVKVGVALFVILALFVSCSKAPEFEVNNVVIREMAPNKDVGVAYLTIVNNGKENLILNYVHSPRTDTIEVHQHLYENGMMQMRQVKHLNVDPNSALELVPGGYHLMLFGVDTAFKQGETVMFTFEFQNHPAMQVEAVVKRL